MNFLACDGSWSVDVGGITCNGTLITITSQEMAEELSSPALTIEEANSLLWAAIPLFALAFSFLVIRKLF